MKTMMYDYIVSYTFSKDGYLTPCTGNAHISRKKKIKTFSDVTALVDDITNAIDGAKNVGIDNLILLGRNWH